MRNVLVAAQSKGDFWDKHALSAIIVTWDRHTSIDVPGDKAIASSIKIGSLAWGRPLSILEYVRHLFNVEWNNLII